MHQAMFSLLLMLWLSMLDLLEMFGLFMLDLFVMFGLSMLDLLLMFGLFMIYPLPMTFIAADFPETFLAVADGLAMFSPLFKFTLCIF